jgi:hypothetical protein
MKLVRSRFAVAMVSAAALSMVASPALAHGRHHHRHDDGIDGGDILAGVLIVGGIAAIASAVTKGKRERAERESAEREAAYDYDPQEAPGYADERPAYPGGPLPSDADDGALQPGGFDGAVEVCVDELERGERRVADVAQVNRTEHGYRVDGRMADSRAFACTVSEEGRILRVAIDGRAI